jgi:hypothetical protein
MEFTSIGKGNAALTTGIIGTAGVGLGLLGNLLGNNAVGCSENTAVSRYEMGQEGEIAKLRSEIALRDANTYGDQKLLEMYKYVDGKFAAVEQQICAQGIVNAQVAANLSCMQNAINTLQGLTKTVIPIDNVCPQPMPALNSWVAPTAAAAG